MGKRAAKRLGVGKQATTLGSSATFTLTAGTPASFGLVVKAGYRAKLKGVRRIKAAVVVACATATGTRFAGASAIALKA